MRPLMSCRDVYVLKHFRVRDGVFYREALKRPEAVILVYNFLHTFFWGIMRVSQGFTCWPSLG
jgi:hypothetical protein